jgi:hypothetical protein
VESGIGYTKRTALKGMRFESLEEAQAYLDRWEERWANSSQREHPLLLACFVRVRRPEFNQAAW